MTTVELNSEMYITRCSKHNSEESSSGHRLAISEMRQFSYLDKISIIEVTREAIKHRCV
jgi:hypothetical protein